MGYSDTFVEAFTFAHELHRSQTRKGNGTPYMNHLMAVAATVGEHGGSEAQVIAALLHDAVEDQGGQDILDDIRSRFGDTVAALVQGCSDTDVIPKPPWRTRKEAFIERITPASGELKLIVAADKLHNMRAMTTALRTTGPSLWDKFRGGRDGSLWYVQAMHDALATGWEHPILHELSDAGACLLKTAESE